MFCKKITSTIALLTIVTSSLSSCGEPKNKASPIPPPLEVPKLIQTMMAAEFPADGEIHTKSQRKIKIEPDTPVCAISLAMPEDHRKNYLGINSSDLFPPLGQSKSTSGSDRQVAANIEQCPDPQRVIIHGLKSPNRNGRPYKLVLAVWQGDPAKGGAVWVGGVERLDGIHPQIAQMPKSEFKDDAKMRTDGSARLDLKTLSQTFVASLTTEK